MLKALSGCLYMADECHSVMNGSDAVAWDVVDADGRGLAASDGANMVTKIGWFLQQMLANYVSCLLAYGVFDQGVVVGHFAKWLVLFQWSF